MNSPKHPTTKLSNYVLVHLDIPRQPHESIRPIHGFSSSQAQCIGGCAESITQLPTPPLSPINPLVRAPTRATYLLNHAKKCSGGVVTSKHPMTSSQPHELPSELVDLIFSFLPLSTLPVVMRTCKAFHAIAERQLYFTVHCIDFFPHVHQQRCLETIANRASAAQSVRHFGVRGLPWLEDDDICLLSSALRAMTRLQSLDMNLGAPPEHDLLHQDLSLSPELEALNVVDPWSAKFACEGGARPIRIARITSPMDECTAREVIPALSQSAGPLRQLQIGLHVFSMADALDLLQLLASKLHHLQTLGVEIRTPKNINDQDFERYARDIGVALSAMSELSNLSLVLPSFRRTGTLEDVSAISSKLPKLTAVELQWGGWTLGGTEWKEKQSWHGLMRRGWLYHHAREPIVRS